MSGVRAAFRNPATIALMLIRIGPPLILLLLVLIFAVAAPKFGEWQNFKNIMVQTAPIALLALGQLFVILVRGVDISVGSTVGLAAVCGALIGRDVSDSVIVVILAMIAVGGIVGLINAFVIVRLNIANPFIVTLGMLSVAHGAALILSDGRAVQGIPLPIQDWAIGKTLGIPSPFFFTLILAVLATVFLRRTQWGRWMYAIGGDPGSAERVGIPAKRVLVSCYILAGESAGLAAIVIAGRFGTGFPDAGTLSELDAISAVVIGGASFFGGRGGVSAALVGALLIGVMRNGLTVSGVEPDW